MARVPAFQAGHAGSIPVTRSTFFVVWCGRTISGTDTHPDGAVALITGQGGNISFRATTPSVASAAIERAKEQAGFAPRELPGRRVERNGQSYIVDVQKDNRGVTVTSERNGIAIEIINQYPTYGPTAPKIDTRDQILEIAQTVRPATKAQVIQRSGTKDGFNPFVSPIIDQHGESDGLQWAIIVAADAATTTLRIQFGEQTVTRTAGNDGKWWSPKLTSGISDTPVPIRLPNGKLAIGLVASRRAEGATVTDDNGKVRYMLSYGRKGNHFPDGDAFMMILPDVEPGTHLTIQGFGTRITKGVAQAEWSATVVAP
jgi:hypothetical protein